MKKIIALLLSLAMVFALAACGSKPAAETTEATAETTEATAEKIVITIAHTSSEAASHQQAALKFKELLEERSNGRFEVQVYANAVMGTDLEMVESVQQGNLTMAGTGFPYIGNFVKEVAVTDMPFRFYDKDVAYKVFADEELISGLSALMEPYGMRLAACEFEGFRTLTANKDIRVPSDLDGLKIRVQENSGHMLTWETLGANPTPLAYNELYTALQQGTVDGEEQPIELINSQKFYEQQKYIIDVAWIPFPLAWVLNEAFWQSLSAEDQQLFNECLAEGIQYGIEYNESMMDSYIKTFEDYGCTFTELTAEEHQAWKDAVEPTVIDYYKETVGEDICNLYLNTIAKYE